MGSLEMFLSAEDNADTEHNRSKTIRTLYNNQAPPYTKFVGFGFGKAVGGGNDYINSFCGSTAPSIAGAGYDDSTGLGSVVPTLMLGTNKQDKFNECRFTAYASGKELAEIDNKPVCWIDNICTVITVVHGNIAKGFILNVPRLTRLPCYVVKQDNTYAHGSTLKQAYEELNHKLFDELRIEDRIAMFWSEFEWDKQYPASKFFHWYGLLTNSCELGRRAFAEENNIDIENDMMTVTEFIDLTEFAYGGEIISSLKEWPGDIRYV